MGGSIFGIIIIGRMSLHSLIKSAKYLYPASNRISFKMVTIFTFIIDYFSNWISKWEICVHRGLRRHCDFDGTL